MLVVIDQTFSLSDVIFCGFLSDLNRACFALLLEVHAPFLQNEVINQK